MTSSSKEPALVCGGAQERGILQISTLTRTLLGLCHAAGMASDTMNNNLVAISLKECRRFVVTDTHATEHNAACVKYACRAAVAVHYEVMPGS